MNKIDFVVLWVDGNDPEWNEEKKKYLSDDRDIVNRFRDWDNLQYLFRGIEKYAEFIGNVFFITWGHTPKWLNLNNTKLKVIKHSDFIPNEFLPTYNSNVIELNLYRIEELSENFVLFNDDLFILQKLKESDFFEDNKVKDFLLIDDKTNFSERYFTIKNNYTNILQKYFSDCYGDYVNSHLTQAFKKSVFSKLWNENFDSLYTSCLNKFRSKFDIGRNVCRYYTLFSKNYIDYKIDGKYFAITDDNTEIIENVLNKNSKIICLNDVYPNIDFKKSKDEINKALETIFPTKSSYEI